VPKHSRRVSGRAPSPTSASCWARSDCASVVVPTQHHHSVASGAARRRHRLPGREAARRQRRAGARSGRARARAGRIPQVGTWSASGPR
jgi:hypothetical protein